MGDIPGRDYDPGQPRYDRTRGWPDCEPGKNPAPFTRKPNWVDPPQSAVPLDLYTDPTVILAIAPNNLLQTVIQYTVPDGGIAVIKAFGNDLENLAAFLQVTWRFLWKGQLYGPEVNWGVGPAPGTATFSWRNFHRSLGDPRNPTRFESPIILHGPGVFMLQADNADIIQHLADARFLGYQWIPANRTTAGDVGGEFMA